MEEFEEAEITVPYQENKQAQSCQFDANPPLGMILLISDSHGHIHHQEIVGMQKTNVVENVGRPLGQTQEKNQKVQTLNPHEHPCTHLV